MASWLTRSLSKIGESIGGDLFDFLQSGQISPSVSRQRSPYVEQFGRSFVGYIATIYLFPLSLIAVEWTVHPVKSRIPEGFFFDLFLWHLEYSYGLHAIMIVSTGSLFLARDLFDNFLSEEVEDGRILALLHIGVAFLITGSAFQMTSFLTLPSSQPNPEQWIHMSELEFIFRPYLTQETYNTIVSMQERTIYPIFYLLYDFVVLFDIYFPFLFPLISYFGAKILVRSIPRDELIGYRQMKLTSERYYSSDLTRQHMIQFDGGYGRLRVETKYIGERIEGFTTSLEYKLKDDWKLVSDIRYSEENWRECSDWILYSYKKGEKNRAKKGFPEFHTVDDAYDYFILYILLHGHSLIHRYKQWHNIDEEEIEGRLPQDHLVEIVARVADYDRPDPLDDESI